MFLYVVYLWKQNKTIMTEIDLFEHYETLPIEVREVLEKHNNDDNTYENCRKLVEDLEKVGYTCDYYLDGIPYDLKKII